LHHASRYVSFGAVSRSNDAFDLVRKHGRAFSSFQTLGQDMHHWFDGEACVAYAETRGSWVVAGGPLTPPDREIEVMEKFAAAAKRKRKRVRFFGLERDVPPDSSFTALHIGEQPVWDPSTWPSGVRKKLRDQIRRATAQGEIHVRLASAAELHDPASPTRRGIDTIIAGWLESRRMAPMGFLVRIDPYHLAEERRFFVAEHKGKVVGVLVAVPIYARNGWFLDQMLRHPDAPNAVVECMFDCAMRQFAKEQSPYVTFGLSPLSGTPSRALQLIRERTTSMYNFTGLRAFKAKLGPTAWQPVYLAYPKHERGVSAVIDSLAAFTPRGLVRFGWDTLAQRRRQGPRSVASRSDE